MREIAIAIVSVAYVGAICFGCWMVKDPVPLWGLLPLLIFLGVVYTK